MSLVEEVRSQAHTAWVVRGLWSLPQLARGIQLPVSWYVRRDGSAPTPIAACQYVTYACPEACTFCNVTQVVEEWTQPLSESDQIKLIDKLVPRIPTLAIGGGEPMAHPGILDHYARIKKRGGRIFTVTSGTSLGPSKARKLAEIGPDVVMFSLLGDEAGHDAAMGRPGAYQRTVGGLSNLLQHRDRKRTRVIINCAVSLESAGSIRAVAEMGRELGVDAVRFTWLSFLTETEHAKETHKVTYLVLPDARLAAFDIGPTLIEARAMEKDFRGFVTFHPVLDDVERRAWYREGGGVERRCHTLWHTLFLRPDASVVPCGHLFDEPVGNLLTDDLDTVWNHPRMKAVRLAQWQKSFEVCHRCCKV
ncbi:MAG: radical SAM protein [Pseudomonadota bacterium]|nr:radical SAM protein [Pseudomonadota bacterium]